MRKEGFKLIGKALIRRIKDGKILDEEIVHNLVVNTGKERVAKLLGGVSTQEFTSLAVGEGVTGALATDTELESEVAEASATVAYEADYMTTFEKTFTFGTAEEYDITEAGIFDGVGSGKVMFDRFTFSAKSVDVDTALYVKVTITVA